MPMLLQRSNFTLAPRGNGASSYRLFEARHRTHFCTSAGSASHFVLAGLGARPPFNAFTACSIVQALQMGTVPVYIWKYTLVGRHSAHEEVGAAVEGAFCNMCLLGT